MISKSLKYRPLKFILSLNIGTLILFLIAPIKWETNNVILFSLFFLCCQFFLIWGYIVGVERGNYEKVYDKRKNLILVNFVFVFYTLTFLIKYAYLLRFYPHQVVEMVKFLSIGVVSPKLGYQMSLDTSRGFTIPWSVYAIIATVNQLFFIIGILAWGVLTKQKKLLFVIFLLIELFYWFGRGTNFGIINIIVIFLLAIFLNQFKKKMSLSQQMKRYIFLGFFLLFGLWVFSYNLNERGGSKEIIYSEFSLGRSDVDERDGILTALPKGLQKSYLYVVSYLGQGYYHTCIAFDLDYRFTYLLGNNPESINIAQLVNLDVERDTYVYRLKDYGIDPKINWHSIYTWIASDVTFFGVPLVFGFFGFLFGFSWIFSISNDDFLSKIVFVMIGTILIFSFANNNYLGTIFYSFNIVIAYWYITRVKRIKI